MSALQRPRQGQQRHTAPVTVPPSLLPSPTLARQPTWKTAASSATTKTETGASCGHPSTPAAALPSSFTPIWPGVGFDTERLTVRE